MAKIQAVWAIDIGQAALKALKLVPGPTPEQVVTEAFDFIEYPKILSQPDADAEELVREALATFTDRNDVKGCRVAIAVPGQAGLVKFIKLPPVEKKRIPDIVKFEAKQQIPFALDEVVWAYQQIGDEDEEGDDDEFTMAEVGLFAMKRDQINRAILPLDGRRHRGRHRPDGPDRPLQLHRLRPDQGERVEGFGGRHRHRRRQHRPDHHRRHPDLAAQRADRRQPLHPSPHQGVEAHLRQGRAPEAERHQGARPPGHLHGHAGGVQRLRQRGQPLDRVLFEHQPLVEDPQGRRPGQRLQTAGPPEVPPAEPQPRSREARRFRPA